MEKKFRLLLLLALLLTAATGAWADEELSNKIWQPSDKFNIGEAWFYFDDTDNGEYYQANGNEFTVPQLNSWSYYSNYKQWATLNFINYKKKVKNGTETTTSGSQKLWMTAPEGKRSADFPPVGFKIVSGAGTKESPYKFGLVYELPLEPYTVTLAEGTEDAGKWTIDPKEAAEGSPVTATYSGEKKVKSVKAVKKAAVDPAKAYMTWDADQKKLVATEIPTEAIMVTISTTTWSAGTYVVEGEVNITGTITLSGDVNLIIKDGATLTAQKIVGGNNKLYIYGQAQMTGELVVDNSGDDATTSIKTLEVHSAKVKASSSYNNRGAFYYTGTINVYGGSVDATAANGYGIWLRPDGSINIYGGEVKAVGKGTGNDSYGIKAGNSSTVTVNGGKLWAENANKQALHSNVTLKKGDGFSGKIEYSSDKSTWSETVDANAKYVRAGY